MKKLGIIALCALIALGVGTAAWRVLGQSDSQSAESTTTAFANNQQQTLETTEAMKAEEA